MFSMKIDSNKRVERVRCGGQVVNVLGFNSDNPRSNPADPVSEPTTLPTEPQTQHKEQSLKQICTT